MAKPMIKLDDGNSIPNDCFPVRPLVRQPEDGDGAWLVAHRAEQRRRFKAIICARPKTYNTIKEERRKAELIAKGQYEETLLKEAAGTEDTVLDGFFLLRHCNVEDPSDLCTIKINALGLSEAKEEDFPLFENVVRINAAENLLPLAAFGGFPALQELEVPLCGLRNVDLTLGDFPNLEYLDVSYNELSVDDVFKLGLIPKLRRLHMSGNNLSRLPEDLAVPHIEQNGDFKEVYPRFNELEILMLDDNKLGSAEVFASLAGLRRLKILNLASNSVRAVPHLRSVAGKIVSISGSPQPQSGRGSRKSRRSRPSTGREESGEDSSVRTSELAGKVETINEKMLELNRPDSAPLICVESALPSARSLDEIIEDRPTKGDEKQLPAPFHTLRSLNVSHNKIENEESVLAVAGWPMLSELIIHDNPFTMRRSGDPPLLKTVLTDRFGVHLIRRKPSFKPRPVLAPETRHKVNLRIPAVPRCDVEKLLALGAPKEEDREVLKPQSPLPPIGKTEEKQEDSVFVTQLDEMFAAAELEPEPVPESMADFDTFPDLNDFSLLMEGEDDLEIKKTLPNTLSGSMHALEYMLSHPLTQVERRRRMDQPQPPMRHLQKRPVAPAQPKMDPATQTKQTLEILRARTSTVEAPLDEVLRIKSHSAGVQRNEAEKLLSDIQRKYNVVRSRSMKVAKQESKQNIGAMVEEIRDQIRRNLEEEEAHS